MLDAIGRGQIAGAALDVFATEPLPPNHPFWAHPAITVWPHVAAQTNPNTAAQQVAAAITAIMAGLEPKTALIGSVVIRFFEGLDKTYNALSPIASPPFGRPGRDARFQAITSI